MLKGQRKEEEQVTSERVITTEEWGSRDGIIEDCSVGARDQESGAKRRRGEIQERRRS